MSYVPDREGMWALLTLSEAAATLDMDPQAVLAIAMRGELKHVRLPDGSRRFPAADVGRLVRLNREAGRAGRQPMARTPEASNPEPVGQGNTTRTDAARKRVDPRLRDRGSRRSDADHGHVNTG